MPGRVRVPLMLQGWFDLAFLHWRYPVSEVRAHVPALLTLDTFDGSAWVGITPFVLKGLRPPFLPPLPWISHFPEMNCRTYVRGPDGKPAIWFFSLDVARIAAAVGARLTYGLPYAWSRMRVEIADRRMAYESMRRWPDRATARIVIERGEAMQPDPLAFFLTARFRLYSQLRKRLIYADVEHEPWPLEAATLIAAEQTITSAAGLTRPVGPAIVHFSPGVRVRVGRPRFMRQT